MPSIASDFLVRLPWQSTTSHLSTSRHSMHIYRHRAEGIKTCDDTTKEMTRHILNEVMKQEDCTPGNMEKIRIKVIYKKNVEEVENFRPTCTLLALYKLFSTHIYNRIYHRLDCVQPEDQAGFRSSYQTTDHLATYRMIEQKCQEWEVSKCGSRRWTS